MPARLRQGDLVSVVTGKYRGKRGRILHMLPEKDRVIVEGVNMVFKHLRRSQQNPKGGRIQREASIHMSNIMPIDPESNIPTRVTTKVVDGKRTRVGRKSGAVLGVQPAKARKGSGKKED